MECPKCKFENRVSANYLKIAGLTYVSLVRIVELFMSKAVNFAMNEAKIQEIYRQQKQFKTQIPKSTHNSLFSVYPL
jgi:hypothetical protein